MKIDKFLTIIIILSILISLFLSWDVLNRAPQSDGAYYNEIANNLIEGKGFIYQGERAKIVPGYPLFIAYVYSFFGIDNYLAVRIIQIILFALSICLIYKIGYQLFNKKIALFSSFIMSIFYVFPFSANKFDREILMMFLLVLLTYFLYQTYLKTKIRYFFLVGLILGFLTLTNGITQLLFIPITILFFFFFRQKLTLKKMSLLILFFLTPYFLLVGSWQIHNKMLTGFSYIAPRGGELLYWKAGQIETMVEKNYVGHFIGHAFGYYFSQKMYPDLDTKIYRDFNYFRDKIEEFKKQGKSYLEINKILKEEGMEKILEKPHKYFLITVLNFIVLNSPLKPYGDPPSNTRILDMFADGRHPEIPGVVKIFILLGFRGIWYLFLAISVYGLIKAFHNNWKKIIWILLILVYFNILYSAIHSLPRFAIPIYPLYILSFSIGLFYLLEKIRKKSI